MLKKMFLIGLVVFVLAGIGFLGVMGLIVANDLLGYPASSTAVEEEPIVAAILPPAVPTKTYNRPTPTPDYSLDTRLWAVYRVTNTSTGNGLGLGTWVSLTYENNTGGTNQVEELAGDGRCHATFKNADGTPMCVGPWAQGYTVDAGDFLYVSAQKLDGYGQLTCEILLTDAEGVDCLFDEKGNCPNTTVWKTAECGGEYCICSVSGLVGYD